MALSPAIVLQILTAYAYIAFWIATSAGVILYNKCFPPLPSGGRARPWQRGLAACAVFVRGARAL